MACRRTFRTARAGLRGLLCAVLCALLFGGSAQTADVPRLRLATTTSVDNSGLLEDLLPVFEKRCACRVDVIAVGTGKALRLGENRDVDVLWVHDETRERAFVEAGHGLYRREIMSNQFVLAGPAEDPAATREATGVLDALRRIANAGAIFVSRGDDSGTHGRERSLWRAIEFEPRREWYRETGQGMGATLNVAHQVRGYVLTDRATLIAMGDAIDLEVLVEDAQHLANPYGVMPVRAPAASAERQPLAESLATWLVSTEARTLIANFRIDGQALFHPSAVSP